MSEAKGYVISSHKHFSNSDSLLIGVGSFGRKIKRRRWPVPISTKWSRYQCKFMRGIGNDLVFLCSGKEILARHDVVCTQAKTLYPTHVAEGLKTENGVEVEYVVNLEHEDLRAVEVMIWFLYFENYPYLDDDPLDTENIIFGDSRFSLHIDVYALALKYGIPALAALAKKLFKKTLDTRFDNQLFVECIPIVYYINPVLDRGLHDLIVDYIKPNLSKLIEDKRSRAQYEALFRSFPQLMVDMIPEIYSCLSTNNPPVVIRLKLPEVDAKDIVEDTYIYSDETGTAYSAALLLTNPRVMTNRFCKLEVLTAPTAPVSNSYLTLCRSGNVRNSEKNSVDDTREILDIGDDEYWRDLRTALSTFRERFRDLTGLKWRDRFDKPLKSKYTFIPDGFEGFDQCATKPWLFDVSRTSTEIITEAAQEEGIMKKSQSLQYTLGKQKTSAGKAGKEFPESPGSLLPTLGEVNTRLKRHQLDSRKGSSI